MKLTSEMVVPGVVVSLLTLVFYLPAIWAGYVYDDVYLVLFQECFRGLHLVPGFFVDPYNACDYRPIRFVTYALDYELAGLDSRMFHLTNILMHGACVWFAWLLLVDVAGWRRTPPERWVLWVAAVGVGVYGLHPTLADAVVPIAGRRDVQSTLLVLMSLWAWTRRPPGPLRGQLGWVGLSLFLWILALLTKEMAVTMPALLVLIELFKTGEGSPLDRIRALVKRFWPVLLVLFVGAAAFGLYRGVFASHSHMQGRWWGGSFGSNLLNVVAIQAEYLRLVFWPQVLLGDYANHTLPVLTDPWHWRFFVGGAVWLTLVVGSVSAAIMGHRLLAFGLGWYVVSISPVSQVIPHHEQVAEHFLHLPMVGLAVFALPAALEWVGARLNRRAVAVSVAVALGLCFFRLQTRIPDFEHDKAFGLNILEEAPSNVRNLGRLGYWYLKVEDPPDYERAEWLAWAQRRVSPPGSIYHRAATERLMAVYEHHYDDPQRAAQVAAESLRIKADPLLGSMLAQLYMRHGLPDVAIPFFESAIAASPEAWKPRVDMGFAMLMKEDPDRALAWAEEALKLGPRVAEVHFLRANVLGALERPRESFESFEMVLSIDAEHLGALMASADMLCSIGRLEQGMERVRRVAKKTPDDPNLPALEAVCSAPRHP